MNLITAYLALSYIASFAFIESTAMASASVPERMLLNAKMEAANIGKAILTALQIDTDTSSTPIDAALATNVKLGESLTADDVIKSHTGKYGSVCFVVRRPG